MGALDRCVGALLGAPHPRAMLKCCLRCAACALLLALVAVGCRAKLTPTSASQEDQTLDNSEVVLLRIAACYSGQPLVQDLSAGLSASNPSLAVDIAAGDSPAPLERLATGQADIAIAALPADGLTPPALPDAYRAYQPTLLAIDALGIMAHKNAAVLALTRDELVKLFGGYVLDWRDLQAGAGLPELVGPQPGTASRELFQARLLGEKALSSTTLLLPHDHAVVDYLATHQLAVGFASVANRDERVHLVALDGVLPTPKGVARGTYPYTWALYALVSPDAPAQAAEWVAFARSATGQDLIAQRYALPK